MKSWIHQLMTRSLSWSKFGGGATVSVNFFLPSLGFGWELTVFGEESRH
jgi:hypothetical protein